MWIYKDRILVDEIPTDAIGFIYKITCIHGQNCGKIYIGRKMLNSKTKKKLTKKEKILPENKRKTYKYVVKDTNWQNYWGSCNELTSDVQLYGENKFKREILIFCFNKITMSYYETYFQIKEDVLFVDSYNKHIANTKFYKGKVNEITRNI